jgi:hypothetical protein
MRISVATPVLLAVLVTACGGVAVNPGGGASQSVVHIPFSPSSATPAGTSIPVPSQKVTGQSGYKGSEPKIELVKSGDRWTLTVYQGQQLTGGYSIAVEKLTTRGTGLDVNARFTVPGRDSVVTDAITSPSTSVDLSFAPDVIVLFDQDGRERARLQR